MPFTLAHPAAILPLCNRLGRYGVLSALVIGSMAPDFPYYAGLPLPRAATHTLLSVIWFSVPVGWCSYLLFQHLLRAPAFFLLPDRVRAATTPEPPPLAVLPVTLSLALGAFTHVVWDVFTHSSGAVVARVPALRAIWIEPLGYPIWSYRVLQHGSTLLGVVVILAYLRHWLNAAPPRAREAAGPFAQTSRTHLRALLLGLPPLLGLAFATAVASPVYSVTSFQWFVANLVVSTLSAAMLLLLVFALVWHSRMRRAAPPL